LQGEQEADPGTTGREQGSRGSSKAGLYANSFVCDRRQVFIGSMNLGLRAMIHSIEIGLREVSPKIAQEMGEWFDRNASLPSGIFCELKIIPRRSFRQYLDNFCFLEFGFFSWEG
jgi:hypothetical protein